MATEFDLPFSASPLLNTASALLSTSLVELAMKRRLKQGETLFEKGDRSDSLFLILTGRLEVSILSADGRKLTLNVLRDREVLGEIALFDGGPRTATVMALAPTELLEVKRTRVLAEIRRVPEIAEELLILAGRRLRWIDQHLEDKTFLPLNVRLARRIMFLLRGSEHADAIAISQGDLADHVGATRVAVANVLAVWRKEGIVSPSRGRLQILRRDDIEDIALELPV
ncbi:MAG: Crp/Fnr family transcriptional regulator [Pseudomonadota bacterium]